MLTRRHLNRLADQHVMDSKTPVTIQKVAKGVGEMRAQIRRTYDNYAKLKKKEEHLKMLETQVNQSKVLTQMYLEKIDYLVDAWPILQGIVEKETLNPEAPVWAFHTLANAYYEVTMENTRVADLQDAIRDTSTEVLNIEMDICELHVDMSQMAEIYCKTSAWQAFPYEGCAECLARTAFCEVKY